jgi:hypothetical protein
VVITSGGSDTNGEGGVAMSICRVLIIENRFAMSSFVDKVALLAQSCLYVLELVDVHCDRVINFMSVGGRTGGSGCF